MARLTVSLGGAGAKTTAYQRNPIAAAISNSLAPVPRKRFDLKLGSIAPAMTLACSLVTFNSAEAAVYEVQNLADSGAGSLRQAVIDANANPGHDGIHFANGLTGIITLESEILISDDLAISGPGYANLTISGNDASRIFVIDNPAPTKGGPVLSVGQVDLSGLTLSNGSASYGGAIRMYPSAEALTIRNSVITGNTADSFGGAIDAFGGVLRIDNTDLTNNSSGGPGGAIALLYGALAITDSEISGNTATDDGGGVYISQFDNLVIDNSTFSNNSAGGIGGAIGARSLMGSMLVVDSTLSGNTADSYGGGIGLAGAFFTVPETTPGKGVCGPCGPSLARSAKQLTISNSSISGNFSTYGGGLFLDGSASLSIVDKSYIINNTAGGGGGVFFGHHAEVGDFLEINASTISGNTATDSLGGGLWVYADNSDLRILNSEVSGNSAYSHGGGIAIYYYHGGDRDGSVTIQNTVVSNNSAGENGGGLFLYAETSYAPILIEDSEFIGNTADAGSGGGLNFSFYYHPESSTVIRNTTIANNTAGTDGGGLLWASYFAATSLLIEDSTISGNSAGEDGGGLHFYDPIGFPFLRNTTLSNNTASLVGGGLFLDRGAMVLQKVCSGFCPPPKPGRLFSSTVTGNVAADAGGIYNRGFSLYLRNAIVSGNTASNTNPDLGGDLIHAKFNLIGDLGSVTLYSAEHNIIGVDPLLGPLQDNGGLTDTHALGVGSPAIDTGLNAGPSTFDQRGISFPRMVGLHTDMGAVESSTLNPLSFEAATFTVTNLNDDGMGGTLREAVDAANMAAGPDVIEFAAGLTGTLTLMSGEITIEDDLVINAPVPSVITISGGNASRIFKLDDPTSYTIDVELVGLTLIEGATGIAPPLKGFMVPPNGGGAIANFGSENLTVRNSVISNNYAYRSGGGIFSAGGVLRIIDTTISNNTAGTYSGGGIDNNNGALIVRNSIIDGNSAGYNGGGVSVYVYSTQNSGIVIDATMIRYNTADRSGGGVLFDDLNMSAVVSNSTISGNTANGAGPGSRGGGLLLDNLGVGSTLELNNTTVSNNSIDALGGGVAVYDGGALRIVNGSQLYGNTASGSGGGLSFTGFGGGRLHVQDSSISNNEAGDSGGGVHIYNSGVDLTIVDSSINGNTADSYGGGLNFYYEHQNGAISIIGSTFNNNTASDGGGISIVAGHFDAPIRIEDTVVSNNSASGGGGGVSIVSFYELNLNRIDIRDSAIENNVAGDNGGGLEFYVSYSAATLVIENTTISGNTAIDGSGGGAAIYHYAGGGFIARNSTISNNTAGSYGGGIYLGYSGLPAFFDNVTITANQADKGGGLGFANQTDKGGGLGFGTPVGAPAILRSSIVSGNTAATAGQDVGGAGSLYLQFSLLQDVTDIGAVTITDLGFNLSGQAPLLGALGDNGGPTATHALLPGSPAINRGINFAALPTDQRLTGFSRSQGERTDMGAFETTGNPTLSTSLTGSPVAEAAGMATINATLTEAAGLPVFVDLGFSGVAVLDTDFSVDGSVLFLPDGILTTPLSVTLTAIDDNITEGDEAFSVDPTSAQLPAAIASNNGVITDDESEPGVTLEVDGDPIAENGGSATITVKLANPSASDVTVNLVYSGAASATDFTAPASIVIPAGMLSASGNLTAVDDALDELDETVIVDIDSVSGGVETDVQRGMTTITDDDNPPEVSLSLVGDPIAEDGGVATITAALSSLSGLDVTVNLLFSGTASAADFTAPSSIVVPAGMLSASIMLTAVDDNIDEPDETIVVDVDGVINGTENGMQQVSTTITDDESEPRVTLAVVGDPIAENGGSATITVKLANPSASDVTVNLVYSGAASATDFTAPASIVIPAGLLSASGNLTAVDDALDELDETVIVDIDSVSGGVETDVQRGMTTITDDDNPPEVSLSLVGDPIAEDGGMATITAALSSLSGLDVTVNLLFSGTASAADFTAPSSIVVPAGMLSASIMLTAVDDNIVEGDETVVVDVDTVDNGDENGIQQVSTTITDDEPPDVSLSLDNEQIPENGGVATITATLSVLSGQDVTVNLLFSGTASPADFTAPGSIVVPAGMLTSSIMLTAIDDPIDELDETVIIDLDLPAKGTGPVQQVTTTIIDDEGPPPANISLSFAKRIVGDDLRMGDGLSFKGGAPTLINEGDSVDIVVTLDWPSSQTITIELEFTGTATLPDDYTVSSTTITIPPGQTSGSVTIMVIDDGVYEPDETIIVNIISVTNAVVGVTSSATGVIVAGTLPAAAIPVPTLSTIGRWLMALSLSMLAVFNLRTRANKKR